MPERLGSACRNEYQQYDREKPLRPELTIVENTRAELKNGDDTGQPPFIAVSLSTDRGNEGTMFNVDEARITFGDELMSTVTFSNVQRSVFSR